MKAIIKSVGDLRISIVLFLIFALCCALATFIESAYKTPTAWAMIYGTTWFGYIQLLLGINLLCGMFRYKMFMLKKLPLMLFHLSFLLILVGAGITRYTGFEGLIHIREKEASNLIESSKSFIRLSAVKDGELLSIASDKDLAVLPFANSLNLSLNLGGEKANLSYKNLILDASYSLEENENGEALLVLMLSKANEQGQEVEFKKGEIKEIGGINFAFLNDEVSAPFVKIDENLELSSSEDLKFLAMQDGTTSLLKANEKASSKKKRLYEFKGLNFVVKFASLSARQSVVGKNRVQDESFWLWLKSSWLEFLRTLLVSSFGEPTSWKNETLLKFKDFAMNTSYQPLELKGQNALKLELSYKGESEEFYIFEYAKPISLTLGGQKFLVSWNVSFKELPFEIYLKDFVIERYPGSMSPASYASEVLVRNKDKEFDYRIFMNNVLDYEGYRFYQSSYDQDEQGTILSVNKDPGKIPTYLGYFLLCLGMFLTFFNPHSRFRKLAKLINEDALKTSACFILAFLLLFGVDKTFAEELPQIPPEHSKNLSTLILQKNDGRMVPFDTVAKEVLEKIYKKASYKNQDANALMLSMMIGIENWQKEPIIFMPKNQAVRDEIARILGVESKPYIAYIDFFDTQKQQYKLQKYIENANRKNPNARGVFDKELINLDERANIVNLIFSGELFRFIPVRNDKNNTWLAPFSAITNLEGEEKAFVFSLVQNYFNAADEALKSKDWSKADSALNLIKEYQSKIGHEVMPSRTKINTEIFINHAEIFVKLTPVYSLAGFLLFILVLAKMLSPKFKINLVFKCVYIFNIVVFLIHTLGLCLRAYLADHAPWSNAYESMVYIAWALALSGIFFSKKSPLSLALTSILAGIVLFVAHLGEMNPQITNLQPVLNSYWLSIHVSVITASYGFLGLCALLGIFVLALMCFLKENGKFNENILRNITEATRINEMAMILGLCLLTIGNFLGAIWANESWGRYWSWDSKETWALISILIYAAILHLRLVPRYNNQYNFALTSMFGYFSIIMTYFGVNYFLVGMHSYAAGEAVQIPSSVYISIALMVILALLARRKAKFIGKL